MALVPLRPPEQAAVDEEARLFIVLAEEHWTELLTVSEQLGSQGVYNNAHIQSRWFTPPGGQLRRPAIPFRTNKTDARAAYRAACAVVGRQPEGSAMVEVKFTARQLLTLVLEGRIRKVTPSGAFNQDTVRIWPPDNEAHLAFDPSMLDVTMEDPENDGVQTNLSLLDA